MGSDPYLILTDPNPGGPKHTDLDLDFQQLVNRPLRQEETFFPVLRIRIRIHRIHVFFGLPDPDPLVRCMDPDPALDPDPSIIMQK
jgi:hypothetical protein